MKIRMLDRIEGTRNGVRWPDRGTVLDLPVGEASDLLAIGIAEKVSEPEVVKPQKATARKAEKRG